MYTNEKVCIVAGPDFGDLEVYLLIINQALYGLRSSGQRWHDCFTVCMTEEEFFPCITEPDMWMYESDGIYEYVLVYVDDLAFVVRDPDGFMKVLQDKYKFSVKGTGPIDYHLGTNFSTDKDGILCMSPKKYTTE